MSLPKDEVVLKFLDAKLNKKGSAFANCENKA